MSKSRTQTWLALIVVAAGLLLAAILGLWAHLICGHVRCCRENRAALRGSGEKSGTQVSEGRSNAASPGSPPRVLCAVGWNRDAPPERRS